ncbi:MAG: T9SS type A sorting domain-containing protein [Bacteroidetes bacterium]|nr:T9SS type A sorting domain-containing protein [Bacteroidota bacterium]
MKNTFTLFAFITLFLYISLNNCKAQSPVYFMEADTLVSSPSYDYKNPTFANEYLSSPTANLFYERHNGSSSDIMFRTASYTGYSQEVPVTNSQGELNINPVFSINTVVWQSNKNGNWDIYYSTYNGAGWSAPVIYPGCTNEDETTPAYLNNNTSPLQYNFSFLIFKRGNDLFLRRYKSETSTWIGTEQNLTDGISENCSSPLIISASTLYVFSFVKEVSPSLSKLNYRAFNFNITTADITWQSLFESNLSETQKNPRYNRDIFGGYYIGFDYGVSTQSCRGTYSAPNPSVYNFTNNLAGSHSGGKGVIFPYIFSNNAAGNNFHFNGFGCVTKTADSTFITLIGQCDSSKNSSTIRKKYIGNASVNSKVDLSETLPSSGIIGPSYKFRAVWEQNVNGRIALMGSSMTEYLTEIPNTSSTVSYKLYQNFPNPFNPTTKINYELKITNFVSLKVFDLLGQEVATLVNEKQNAGNYAVDFNSTDFNLPSGIYFYTLNAGKFNETRKMILIK